MHIENLTCEYQINPLGLGVLKPRFSWQLCAEERHTVQIAYQILVHDGYSAGSLIWNSSRIESEQSVQIEYNGPQVTSRTKYSYQVTVWDNHGSMAIIESSWETGILGPTEWSAEWITPDLSNSASNNSEAIDMLRKTFDIQGSVRNARLYATSLGLYEVQLNGEKVGNDHFTPGWTSYNNRLQTQTYDITKQLQSGTNAIGVILADGWYKGNLAWEKNRNIYGDTRALLLELHIQFEDGSVAHISSDSSWKASTGPILYSELYHGETYDARLEQRDWSCADFTDSHWLPVNILSHGKEMLIPQENEPVRIMEELQPIAILTTPRGETVIDFGQNMVGWVEFSVMASSGTEITIQHAEVLDKEGNFFTENMRSAKQLNRYICCGNGKESFHPHFSFQGFRYVKIEGYPGLLASDNFIGKVIYSNMQANGQFECSNPLLNQLQKNIVWGQKGNFLDIPTDCPQRDERLGWTGDAQVFIRTACFNMNVAPFFTKWLRDLKADQLTSGGVPPVIPSILKGMDSSSAWGDAAVICPWTLYLCYGDSRILAEQYDSMKAWVDYIRDQGENRFLWNSGFHFGDWLGLDAKENSYTGATLKDLIATAFYAYSTELVSRSAAVLGFDEDAKAYSALHRRIVEHFSLEFMTPNGRLASPTQTAQVLALMFELVEGDTRKRVASDLARMIEDNGFKLTTGFVGTPYLCHVLSQNVYLDVAYKLLLQQEYPSWLYSVNKGATTIWEHWDGIKEDGSFWSNDMNSFNHYAYGAVGDWMYRVIAGIEIDEQRPGYRHVRIQPQPGGNLSFAKASYKSLYGLISSDWEIIEGDEGELTGPTMHIKISIPPNTSATVILPQAKLDQTTESKLHLQKVEGLLHYAEIASGVKLELTSGNYAFEYPFT